MQCVGQPLFESPILACLHAIQIAAVPRPPGFRPAMAGFVCLEISDGAAATGF